MEENPNLPEEILIQIFWRLPTKAVGRCRCASKTWRIQLSTSQFLSLHRSGRTNPENQIFILMHSSIYTSPMVDNIFSRKLELGVTWNRLLGCCNGLFLLSNTEKLELFLVNPITLQHFKLPPLSSGLDDKCKYTYNMHRYGLGYDSSSDDYKVVVLTYFRDRASQPFRRWIDVYSVKSGAWNSVDNSNDYAIAGGGGPDGTFMNGALHWISFSVNDDCSVEVVIDAFDLASNVFCVIPAVPSLHNFVNVWNPDCSRLPVVEGCLCMLRTSDDGGTELWMMKQYGFPESWTKFAVLTRVERDSRWPVCSIGDGEIMSYYHCKLFVHNLKEGTRRHIVVDGVPSFSYNAVDFVDSLVSPNHQG